MIEERDVKTKDDKNLEIIRYTRSRDARRIDDTLVITSIETSLGRMIVSKSDRMKDDRISYRR